MAGSPAKAALACALALCGLASAPGPGASDPRALPPVERGYRYPNARIVGIERSHLPSLKVRYETGDTFARVKAFYTAVARKHDAHSIASCTSGGDFCMFMIGDGRLLVTPTISARRGGAAITLLFFVPSAEKKTRRR